MANMRSKEANKQNMRKSKGDFGTFTTESKQRTEYTVGLCAARQAQRYLNGQDQSSFGQEESLYRKINF